MTEPLPDHVRQAGYNALEELSTRMFRGATSLLKHAVRLRMEEPKSHREALAQLRRYQGFKMPCSEEVAVIEGALTGLTESESKALTERRRIQKMHKDAADTATIIAFPVVKRPPAKKPISRQERLHQIFNASHVMERQGLAPKDVAARMSPERRQRLREVTAEVIAAMDARLQRDPDSDPAA